MNIPVYATPADRDAAITAPVDGDAAVVHDDTFELMGTATATLQLTIWVDGAWVPFSIWTSPELLAVATAAAVARAESELELDPEPEAA